MSVYFWISIALMTMAATVFLVLPFRQSVGATAERRNFIPFALIVTVPVIAIVIYATIGKPELAVSGVSSTSSAGRSNNAMQGSSSGQLASVADLVDGLRKRLDVSPDDAGGWLLLAKSYQHLGRVEETAEAYARATALGKTDADVSTFLASHENSKATASTMIRGRVELTGQSARNVDGTATVFVVARNANGAQMPLAVVRTPLATLPFEFTLHDGMAMVAGNDLSSAENVIITAKISETGDALSTLPGFETESAPVSTANPEFVTLALGQ